MKLLFIYPNTHTDPHYSNLFPFGILSLITDLEINGWSVDYIETTDANTLPSPNSYDAVLISFMTPQAYYAYKIAERVKTVDSDIPIIVGGPHPTTEPRTTEIVPLL